MLASTALNDYVDFPHVAQVCRIEREVTELKSGKRRHETVFAINLNSSVNPIREPTEGQTSREAMGLAAWLR